MSGVVNCARTGEKPPAPETNVTGIAGESWPPAGGFSDCMARVIACAATVAWLAGVRIMTWSHANSGCDGHGF